MALVKNLSLSMMAKRFGSTIRRFPLAVLFTLLLTGFLIFLNHGGKVSDKMEFFLVFYPATGILLAIALSLFTEDFGKRVVAWLVQAVVHAAWLGVSIYLARLDRFSLPQTIAVSATVAAIGFAVFLICFYRRKHELPFWNFSIRTVTAVFMSAAIGGALTFGLLLLVESLNMLFDIYIRDAVYGDIWTLCMVLLAPLLFMSLIPTGRMKYLTEAPEFSRFAKGVVQYVFLPLLGLYILTLYAYAAKILLEWTLPVGGVSYLVSGSMLLMVLLIYITYPIQHQEGNKLFKNVTRWLPVALFPLLALMTVAIGRRLADYGITVSRLYLLVFNLWCYGVCLWLILTRNKRIWLIPASFAVILFLISVGPQSIANVTQRQLKKEARTAFMATGIKQLPLTGDQYEKWLNSVDGKVAASIDAKLDYLQRDFGYNSTCDLLAKDVITGTVSNMEREEMSTSTSSGFCNYDLVNYIKIPQGYSRVSMVEFHTDQMLDNDDKFVITVVPTTGPVIVEAHEDDYPVASPPSGTEYRFEAASKQLIERDQNRNPQGGVKPLIIDNGEAMLMINRFSFTLEHDKHYYLGGDGILFTK
jgi:hypothetical protein